MKGVLGLLRWILLTSAALASAGAADRCLLELPLRFRDGPAGVELLWRTFAEFGVVGFELLGSDGKPCHSGIIGAANQPAGAAYAVSVPATVLSGQLILRVWTEDGVASDHPVTCEPLGDRPWPPSPAEGVVAEVPSRRPARPAAGVVECVDLLTSRDGVHYVSFATLAAAFQVSETEVAQRAAAGTLGFRQDGVLVPFWSPAGSTGCHFLARRLDSLYFAGNVTQVRLEPGLKLTSRTVAAEAGVPRTHARSRLDVARKTQAIVTLPGAPEEDFWVWDSFLGGSATLGNRSYAFDLPGLVPAADPAPIVVDLATTSLAPHEYSIGVNGQSLGSQSWTGSERRRLSFAPSSALLRGASNVLQIISAGDRLSLGYLYGFSVEFPRLLETTGGPVHFWSADEAVLEVRGPAGGRLEVWEVDDPRQPVRLQRSGGAEDRLVFRAAPGRVYAAFHVGSAPEPVRVTPFGAPTLATGGADYLLVAPDGWTGRAALLAQRRVGQGLRSEVVPLSAIHHEFGFGKSTPVAVTEFLKHARTHWNPAPRMAVLVGDGHYDYQDHLGRGDNLVPPLVSGTLFGRVTTDVLFGDFDRDGRPEMAVGRLPARNEAEWLRLLGQIETFESRVVSAPKALVLADRPDAGGDFIANAESLAGSLAAGFEVRKVYNQAGDVPSTRAAMLQQLAVGMSVFNYVGHGARDRFGNAYLASADVPSVSFGEEQPLVVAMTCSAGQFGVPGFSCLAEVLVLKTGRAPAAVWSASGYSLDFQTHLLNQIFTGQLAQAPRGTRLGDLVRTSLTAFRDAGGDAVSPALYNLMGDPALALNFGAVEARLQAQWAPTGVQLTLTASPNRQYRVEATDRLRSDGSAAWTIRRSVSTDPTGTAEWVEPVDSRVPAEFFRVVAAP